MYVGSTYTDTGETLSSLSDKSEPYFTAEASPRHRGEYGEGWREAESQYLVEPGAAYGAQTAHSSQEPYSPCLPPAPYDQPPSRALSSVYGHHGGHPGGSPGHCTLPRGAPTGPRGTCTLPRQPPQPAGRPHLQRQRSVSNLDCEGKDKDSLVWL